MGLTSGEARTALHTFHVVCNAVQARRPMGMGMSLSGLVSDSVLTRCGLAV